MQKMKVIFVASGNQKIESIAPFVQVQMDSLAEQGVEISLYRVVGRGIKGYVTNTIRLRKILKREQPDIVHAHYSICGYLASIANLGLKSSVVVSLMGSDMVVKLPLIRFFAKKIWDMTIVKSREMYDRLNAVKARIIPNGVNIDKMCLLDRDDSRKKCGFEDTKQYVIWCSQIDREEKNYPLAQKAVDLLSDKNVVLLPVQDAPHHMMNVYMRAADVLLLTSKREGSPNVIKEAMACNLPIVSTNVGDVEWLLDHVEGAYITQDDTPQNVCECLKKALTFMGNSTGRQRLIDIGLTTRSIASDIINIYTDICRTK